MNLPPEILALVRQQQAELEGIAPGHVARLVAIGVDLRAEFERQLQRLAPGRFTTQQTRMVLARVRALVELLGAEMGQRIGDEIEALGKVAAKFGRDGLLQQLQVWSADHGLPTTDRTRLARDLLDPGLVEYYEDLRGSYGAEFVQKMRTTLVRGAISNETVAQTTERLAAVLDVPESRAEMIVRTEQSFAKHRRELADTKALDLGLAKQLVTTFDDRTGEDSKFVDGQVRALDEPFEDNEGRTYQHPPNRPNDREVMVMVPEEMLEEVAAPTGATGPPQDDVDVDFGPDIGKHSGRPFDKSKAGGPLLDLQWRNTKIDHEAVEKVRQHMSRFVGRDPQVDAMLNRALAIADGRLEATPWDKRFVAHELRERQRYEALGWKDGVPEDPTEATILWNNAHTATLEEYKMKDIELLHPVVRNLVN